MTRYVEESEVIRVLTEYYHLKTDTQIAALSEALSRVPDADVVELVRCKDCKHGRPYKHTKDYVSCEVDCDPIDRDSNFFCKSGERRE